MALRAVLTLRPAKAEDFPIVCGLWQQGALFHARIQPKFFRVPTEETLRQRFEKTMCSTNGHLLVAELDGLAVGVLELHVYDTPKDQSMVQLRRLCVDDVVVDAGCRRRGIGRALMEAAVDLGRRHRAQQLVLTVWNGNKTAHEFYRSLGYTEINTVLGVEL
ncbi:MAG: GNAT family N-acetyltransferase [Pseudomonadota bacterium]